MDYLNAAGVKRIKRPKAKKSKSKRKAKTTNKATPGIKVRKGSSTEKVLNLIQKNKEGISIDDIVKKSKVDKKALSGILNRLKKAGNIKNPKRGFYTKG